MMAVNVAKGGPVFLLGGRRLIKKDSSHDKEFISHVDFCKAGLQWTPRLKKQHIRSPAVCCRSFSGNKNLKAIAEKGRKFIQQCPKGALSCPCNEKVLLFDVERITHTVNCSNSSSSSPLISNEDSVDDTFSKQYDSDPSIRPDEPLRSPDKVPTSSSTAQFQANLPVRRKFKGNRFLWWLKLRSNFNTAFERFFKSEIRRRAFVTVTLLIVSRIGYFIPLPGFDRRALPSDYLGFVSGRIEELGDLGSEMKLSIFQLGISPYLLASMGMQLACHLIPSLVKLRTKGFDGHAKIKKYTFRLTLLFAILESLAIAYYSLPYAVCAAGNTFRHMTITTSLLTFGAMTLHWISEKITTAGFGEGSSLIVCLSILTGYANSLQQIARSITYDISGCSALCLLLVSSFTITLWAVVVNEGRRKIKMQYVDLALMQNSGRLRGLPEVEPYIPFNINPTGMQPILTTSYLLAFPGIVARYLS
ncbi:hypothetical protein O6H91_23G025600 [Diphasiastrum complanatum]|uniref:Uncharacterized protein n=1 Tax=Diphasiastrum complanatum TaxID=34168 RepID=A0ACC2A976_DIPCM|nr:hypothetical protein O6H91_23G025600 [Diphasiastrum complanatum]